MWQKNFHFETRYLVIGWDNYESAEITRHAVASKSYNKISNLKIKIFLSRSNQSICCWKVFNFVSYIWDLWKGFLSLFLIPLIRDTLLAIISIKNNSHILLLLIKTLITTIVISNLKFHSHIPPIHFDLWECWSM